MGERLEMMIPGKNLNTPKTAYCDFFRYRPNLPPFQSHKILNNEYITTQRPPTMQTVTRCGDNVLADIDSATGTVVRTYVTPMLDANVSMTIAGATPATYYYSQDERQSVMNLTDLTGAVVQSYGYTAYGDKVDTLTHSNLPTFAQRYTFTGRELSTVSDGYYFRYRWYGAASGSFMSRDPLKYVDGFSMYVGWFVLGLEMDPMGKTREVITATHTWREDQGEPIWGDVEVDVINKFPLSQKLLGIGQFYKDCACHIYDRYRVEYEIFTLFVQPGTQNHMTMTVTIATAWPMHVAEQVARNAEGVLTASDCGSERHVLTNKLRNAGNPMARDVQLSCSGGTRDVSRSSFSIHYEERVLDKVTFVTASTKEDCPDTFLDFTEYE